MASDRQDAQEARTEALNPDYQGVTDTAESVQADAESSEWGTGTETLPAVEPDPGVTIGATLTDDGIHVSIVIPHEFVAVRVTVPEDAE